MKSISKTDLLSAANRYDDQAYWVGHVILYYVSTKQKPDLREEVCNLSKFINEERKADYPNLVSGLLAHFETILRCMARGLDRQGLSLVRSEVGAISQGCAKIATAYT